MLKFLSPFNVVIGNVLVSILQINISCATFTFLCNIVIGNMFVFLLKLILAHVRFISPYNVVMCFYAKMKFNVSYIYFTLECFY